MEEVLKQLKKEEDNLGNTYLYPKEICFRDKRF